MYHKTQHHRYIPGLDGLRAFAVLSVIAYHLNFNWANGGFIGVGIFFVLSGYLITSILLPAHGNDISLDFRDFWVRRIRRLLPAAYLMIFSAVIWVVLFDRELLHTVRGDAISSLLYISNWYFIFHKLSYFDSFGSPSPLKNLWSLAIEEQFYMIWPMFLVVGMYIFKSRARLAAVVSLLALCSAVMMSILYEPGADPSRVYYGTDTRSFELLIGCALALVWPMKRLSSNRLPSKLKHTLHATELSAFCILVLCVYFTDEYEPFLYRGGMLLISMVAAILIACVCHPSSFLGNLLSWRPLRWLGTRSYGIYLWHYPVIVLSTPVQEIGNPVFWHIVLKVIVTFILAELSYHFIEKPIRTQGFRFFFRRVFIHRIREWKTTTVLSKMSIGFVILAVLIFAGGLSGLAGEQKHPTKWTYSSQETNADTSQASEDRKNAAVDKDKENDAEQKTTDSHQDQKENKNNGQETSKNKDTQSQQEKEPADSDKEVLAIGDSVMLDIASHLRQSLSHVTIDGKVGRQMSQALELTREYKSFNQPNKAVIIELGTNGYFTDSQIEQLLQAFSKAHIYLVNTRVPRQWESKVNESLKYQASAHKNVTLVDWHTEALQHPEYFTPDGVHLVPQGAKALTGLIVEAMESSL
ncbi:acyltransferase family protein [Bacillus spizizenii]|uniref:O-acetyltransferase OatA n=1 Tax=Bacillus spizizenii (strain DSM 15029 / JCM 12233 / NBRC 101239 / NRRL B-23049 / TU-B-10) TaxID=1052585 RepID=G4NXW6_BACS4|nr:acyltransferase family protein [Bacillus spizizenii]AEP87556.1 O-acetyltransferase OatA [Bacillus spizizenii TU-B-10]GEK26818.1 putative peptidoglycan O-acetyltransferase YrhL [Bacillus spizizenii]